MENVPEIRKPDKRITLVVLHRLVWLIFLSLPAVFKPRPAGVGFNLSFLVEDLLTPPRWTNGLLLVALFYSNYFFVIPKLYVGKRYIFFALSIAVCFGIFFLLNYLLMPEDVKRMPSGGFEALGNSFNLFMFLVVYAFSFSLGLYDQWQKTKEQMLTTQLSFLKAQINPHFLFNTLNSIYSLTLTKSDKAPDAVVKLSGMMRYSVTDANHNFVSLSKELEYIRNYIELQQLRLSEKVKLQFEVEGSTDGRQVAPFLLIPFVENAFKYGVNAEEDSDIQIRISIGDKALDLQVFNKKVFLRKDKNEQTGIGINTTRQRLALLYPGRHKLIIDDGPNDFNVSLQISYQ